MAKEPIKRKRFTGNAYKYTESELKDRGCGKCLEARDQKWYLKKATYTNEGVWTSFTALRDSFRALFTDADKYVYNEVAHNDAQRMMDTFLIRRSRGELVQAPLQVMPINAVPDDDKAEPTAVLLDKSEFSSSEGVSENEKLRWVFEMMKVDGLKPADAPSPGAWSLLHELRGDEVQRRDFYKTLWPKLLTKEDFDKSSKLNDDGKKTIELIERLIKALPDDTITQK